MWQLAGFAFGCGLGLFFGRLLFAVIQRWEGAETATKIHMGVFVFVLGGGSLGGSYLFRYLSSPEHGAFYLLGTAIGVIYAYFWPHMPRHHSLEGIKQVLRLSDAGGDIDIDSRAILILSILEPPSVIQKRERLSEQQLAQQLDSATDEIAARDAHE